MARPTRQQPIPTFAEQFRAAKADYDAAKQTRFKRTRTGVIRTGSGSDYHKTAPWYWATAHFWQRTGDRAQSTSLTGASIRKR